MLPKNASRKCTSIRESEIVAMDEVAKATAVLVVASTMEHDPTYIQHHKQRLKSAETLP